MRQRIVIWTARPEYWLCLLLTWMVFSAWRAFHTPWARAAGTEALHWSAGLLLTLVLGQGLRRTTRAAQALTVLLGSLVVAIIYEGRHADGLLVGPYGDHQLCASALLALLPFSLALALAPPTPTWRWSAQIITVAGVLCLALTETRSAWIGAAFGGTVFAVLWLRHPTTSLRIRQCRAWIMPALLTLSVAGAFLLLTNGTDLSRPLTIRAQTLQSIASVSQDKSWQARVQTWRGATAMVAAHPVIGWGLGRYPSTQWAWTHTGRPLSPTQRPSLSEQAHDFYLQTLVETGWVGLILYLAALAALAGRCVSTLHGHRHRSYGVRQALSIAALSLIAGQGVDALVSPSWQFPEVSLLFWAGLGLGLAACQLRQEDVASAPAAYPVRRAFQLGAAGVCAILLATVILPTGLLTPVEAYNDPTSGANFGSLTLSPSNSSVSVSGNGQLSFTMTITYTDRSGAHSQDVTLDPATSNPMGQASSYAVSLKSGAGCHSAFNSNPSLRNILILNAGDATTSGTALTVLGKVYFNGVSHAVNANVTVFP